jgi:uncharacterized protein (UPF0332 family)
VAFEYRTLIGVARHLTQQGGERYDRSAVNRAYYSLYGEARALATRRGWEWKRGAGGSHEQVWNFLKRGAGATAPWERALFKAIGDSGAAFKDHRVHADYRPEDPLSSVDAAALLERAEFLLKRIIHVP